MSKRVLQPERSKPTRLADVAREAGVSLATASKVLMPNGGNNTRVGRVTAARVRAIARQLNFRPNRAARQLAGESSHMLGVVIDSLAPEVQFRTLSRIEWMATQKGYRLVIGQTHERPEVLIQYAEDFASRGVEGVFCLASDYPAGFYPRGLNEAIVEAFARVRNVLFIGQPQAEADALPYIASDVESGIAQAYAYLRKKGRERPGLVVMNQRYLTGIQRVRGFEAAVAADGAYDPKPLAFVGDRFGADPDLSTEFISAAVQKLVIEQEADALIGGNDLIAVHLIKRLKKLGLRVPDDVAVVGYDNLQIGELYEPALTTVDQNAEALCEQAVAAMLQMIEGEWSPDQCRRRVQPYLVPRESA